MNECPRTNARTSAASTHVRTPEPVPPVPVPVAKTAHTWSPKTVPVADCVAVLEKEISSLR